MSRLTSTLTNLFLLMPLIAGLSGSMVAQAQTGTTATVPFAFSANNVHVPAGTYKVQLLSERFMCLRNIKTGKNQCLVVRPESEQNIESQGRLVFQRFGLHNYLAQVWIAGTNIHSELALKHAEQTPVQGNAASPGLIEVALK
jgi:hypothetical protein